MQYTYHINIDERGRFNADVRNSFEKTVFEIDGSSIFEDGFMKNKYDLPGLQDYLQKLKIISSTDNIKNEMATGGVFSNSTGGFSLEYLKDPEYLALDANYKELANELSKVDKYSNKARFIAERMEAIQDDKKTIAIGGASFSVGKRDKVENLHYKDKLISAKFKSGGSLGNQIEEMLEEYEPNFQYIEKSDVDTQVNKAAGEKKWVIYFKVVSERFDRIKHDSKYREERIEQFKQFGYSKGKKFKTLMYDVTVADNFEIVYEVTDSFAF